jgi:DNA-binding MarR family transcriptional regulator
VNYSQDEPRPADDDVTARAAEALVTVVPRAMRQIRSVARSGIPGLSVPQFRALRYINRHPGSGLTPVAEHLGVSMPSASALIGRLAVAGFVERDLDPTERRRLALNLTPRGRDRIAASTAAVDAWWRARLAHRSPAELELIVAAMELLDASLPDSDTDVPTPAEVVA